jgi:hypothetical protein
MAAKFLATAVVIVSAAVAQIREGLIHGRYLSAVLVQHGASLNVFGLQGR